MCVHHVQARLPTDSPLAQLPHTVRAVQEALERAALSVHMGGGGPGAASAGAGAGAGAASGTSSALVSATAPGLQIDHRAHAVTHS